MPEKPPVAFLFDVDNTLLDNDRVITDLGEYLQSEFGSKAKARYFAIFESLRNELGYADYLGALQRYRIEHPRDVRLLRLSSFLIDYPFKERLFFAALDSIAACLKIGPAIIVSDGDVVFQPRKIRQSGIFEAVSGHVLIYIHKEQMLDDLESRYPAERYVFVDDKPRLCLAIKDYWKDRVTTILPKQGHYAKDVVPGKCPGADHVIEHIGDLRKMDLKRLSA